MDLLVNAVLAGVTDGASYGLIALGVVLVYKATRVLNFAQAEIGTVALYVAWFLTTVGVPVAMAVLVALILAAIMGIGLEYVLRPLASAPPLTITVATLGVSVFLGAAQISRFGTDARVMPALIEGNAFTLAAIDFRWGRVLALLVTAALGVGLFTFFKRTLFGLGVLASAQDPTALRLMGMPFNRVSAFTWGAGAVLSALAALILAPTLGAFTPFFMTQQLIPALAAALVGGLTSLPGAFVGGLTVGIAQSVAKFYWGPSVPGAEFVAVFALMIAVLLFKPNGLVGAEA